MARVGIVTADFVAKVAKFIQGTKKARGSLKGFRADVKQTQALLTGLFTLTAVGGFVSSIRDAAAWADELANSAARVGVGIEPLQALRAEAEKFGVSIQQTDTAIQRFSRRVGEAQQGTGQLLKVFQQYNIALSDSQGRQKTVSALLEEYRRLLSATASESERNRIAMAAFDSEGVKFGQTLSNLNGTIDDTTASLLEQGRVMREDSVQAAAAFQTRFTEAVQTTNQVWRSFVINVVEGWQTILNGFRIGDINASMGGTLKLSQQIVEAQDELSRIENQRGRNRSAGHAQRLADAKQNLDSLKKQKEELNQITVARRKAQAELGKLAAPGEITAPNAGGRGAGSTAKASATGIKAVSAAQEELNRMMAEGRILAEQLRTPIEKYADHMSELHTLLNTIRDGESAITMETFTRATAKYQEELHAATAQIEETNEFAKELGLTFSSAFEDAIVEGNNLRDVLKGLEQDMIRIITRQLVTTPLSNAIGGMVSGGSGGLLSGLTSAISGIFGGARAAGGPVNTGKAYLVGENGPELFVPNTGGNISPSAATVVNVNFNAPVTGEGVRQSAQQIAAQVGAQTRRAMARNG